MFRERAQGGAPCRTVRAIVGDRLARIDAELAALTTLKSDLTALLADWDAKLDHTPPNQPAKLLESLRVSGGDGCAQKWPSP